MKIKLNSSDLDHLMIPLANPEGDHKGSHSTPLHSRPYKDTKGLSQQYLNVVVPLLQLIL